MRIPTRFRSGTPYSAASWRLPGSGCRDRFHPRYRRIRTTLSPAFRPPPTRFATGSARDLFRSAAEERRQHPLCVVVVHWTHDRSDGFAADYPLLINDEGFGDAVHPVVERNR